MFLNVFVELNDNLCNLNMGYLYIQLDVHKLCAKKLMLVWLTNCFWKNYNLLKELKFDEIEIWTNWNLEKYVVFFFLS